MKKLCLGAVFVAFASAALSEEIGSVDTTFKFLGPDNRIVVEVFDDPQVEGVSCYVSRAVTGGISGGLGLAENTSDASIACRQTGPIALRDDLKDGQEVFSQRSSVMFKELHVVRFHDEARNALVYLTYSDKLIDGSPKNSISAVVMGQWN